LLIAPTALGGFAAQWLHKQIGKFMRNPGGPLKTPENPPNNFQSSTSSSANSPKQQSTAHDKAVGNAVLIGIVSFIILIFVCRTTIGGGLFAEPETVINWPGVFMGTGVCAFVTYFFVKRHNRT